jgi:O-antigen ligase
VSTYSLATRLAPDRLDTLDDPTLPYRLSEPLGYWNALGLLVAMGLIVALGFAAHSRRWWFAMAAALALPILGATLYFTFSRGAWAALVFGLCGMIALDPRRLRLLWTLVVVAPATVACVAYASRQDALTTEDASTARAVTEGHRMALVVVGLALCSGLLAGGAFYISRHLVVSRRIVRTFNVGLASLVVVAAAAVLIAAGGPRSAASELKARFDAEPVGGVDLNARLFSASSNGRSESIGVAWDAFRDRPALGHGAGSFEYVWYERREIQGVIRDAHSLYAETLSEVGAVGLALLLGALVIPLIAAFQARRTRFVAAGAGAYLAWLAASALDWHWEMVGVTITALLAGGVGLLAADRHRPTPLPIRAQFALIACSVVLTVLSLVSLVGNQALFAGKEALTREDWASAAQHARRAQALLAWSHEPELVLGDAAAGLGDRETTLSAYRNAVSTDSRNWVAWLRLAQVARGAERRIAYARVHELNPLEEDLPGEPARDPG